MTVTEEQLVEARNDARRIVAEGMAEAIQYSGMPTSPLEGPAATQQEWCTWLYATAQPCPHPRDMQRGDHYTPNRWCGVCGWCWHRVVVRESQGRYETGWCEDCMEERRLEDW